MVCTHKNEEHHADNNSHSGGCIYWCPNCGAISSTSDRRTRDWIMPELFKEQMEKWLNGWMRQGDTVLIGSGLHCVGCGFFLGTCCVILSDCAMPSREDPDYPFEQASCPVCQLRNRERDEPPSRPTGSFAKFEERMKP